MLLPLVLMPSLDSRGLSARAPSSAMLPSWDLATGPAFAAGIVQRNGGPGQASEGSRLPSPASANETPSRTLSLPAAGPGLLSAGDARGWDSPPSVLRESRFWHSLKEHGPEPPASELCEAATRNTNARSLPPQPSRVRLSGDTGQEPASDKLLSTGRLGGCVRASHCV